MNVASHGKHHGFDASSIVERARLALANLNITVKLKPTPQRNQLPYRSGNLMREHWIGGVLRSMLTRTATDRIVD